MPTKPRVFLDADVVFAGSAAPSIEGASYVVLGGGDHLGVRSQLSHLSDLAEW